MDRSKPAEIAERLRSLLNRDAGLTQAALARFCDVSSAAVAKWCYQGVISPQNLMQAAKFFNVSHVWLATGEGEKENRQPVRSCLPKEEKTPPGVVIIPVYKLVLSAGDGHNPDWEEVTESEPMWFPESFFIAKHVSPSVCKVAEVIGDSMEPTLSRGDKILWAEEGDSRPAAVPVIDGQIYVLAIDGAYKVKRLRKIKDGLLVSSDNPAYPPERYVKEECDRIQIFGRALHASREL